MRRNQICRFFRISIEIQKILIFIHGYCRKIQTYFCLLMRLQIYFKVSGSNILAILNYLPSKVILIQIRKIITVFNCNNTFTKLFFIELNILIHLLHFISLRLRNTIGGYNPISTRVQLPLFIFQPFITSHFSIVRPVDASVSRFCLHFKPLIHKVPNKTTLQIWTVINNIPKVFEVTITIPLGMGILTHDKGALFTGLGIFRYFPHIGIHRTYNICIPVLPSLFELHKTTWVIFFQTFIFIMEYDSITTFIP